MITFNMKRKLTGTPAAAPPQTIVVQAGETDKSKETFLGLNPFETTVLKYVVGGVVVVGGVLLLTGKVSGWIDGKQLENHLEKSSQVGSPDYYARELEDAFNVTAWYGNTDREKVETILLAIPSQDVWAKVQAAYVKAYNKPLLTEMREELGDFFGMMFSFQDAMNIINKKPAK